MSYRREQLLGLECKQEKKAVEQARVVQQQILSNISIQNVTLTKKIVDNIAIIENDTLISDCIDLNNRIHNHNLLFLITSDIECSDLDVVFEVSMDNELYYKLHTHYIEYHSEGKSIQVVINNFIPRYMRLSITNNGFLISNTTVYLTF